MTQSRHVGLTRRQLECLNFIRTYIGENGIAPSYNEINDALGLNSKSGVHRMVRALEKRGHIRRLEGLSRSIELVNPPKLSNDSWVQVGIAVERVLNSIIEENRAEGYVSRASAMAATKNDEIERLRAELHLATNGLRLVCASTNLVQATGNARQALSELSPERTNETKGSE